MLILKQGLFVHFQTKLATSCKLPIEGNFRFCHNFCWVTLFLCENGKIRLNVDTISKLFLPKNDIVP